MRRVWPMKGRLRYEARRALPTLRLLLHQGRLERANDRLLSIINTERKQGRDGTSTCRGYHDVGVVIVSRRVAAQGREHFCVPVEGGWHDERRRVARPSLNPLCHRRFGSATLRSRRKSDNYNSLALPRAALRGARRGPLRRASSPHCLLSHHHDKHTYTHTRTHRGTQSKCSGF